MSWPVRLMEEMVQQIKDGRFDPDASRSGYFPKGVQLPEESKDIQSSSSSGDSRDEENYEHSEEEKAVEKFAGEWGGAAGPEGAVYFRHKVSRCLHLTSDESGLLFKCGRMVTGQYDKCAGTPTFLHPSCAMCFRG
eukprot:s892_g27.t1